MTELTQLTATEMAARIRRRELSPVDLVEAHLKRIKSLNPQLNAFVKIAADDALEAARDAEKRCEDGQELGPLHGVPISIKSAIEVKGMPWESGSALRRGVVGRKDAPLVQRLRKAGAIVIGVTNTPELLMAWETDNLLYGRTNNPFDLTCTAGGSSGGEAAAIAAGLSAGGVGSDGGGSIRVPSHFCGICGLKPTPGRIPSTGHFPQSAGPFSMLGVVGPMARTIGDLRLLFEVMQGPDDGDPAAAPVALRWPTEKQLKNTAIGYFEDDGRTPVTEETRTSIRNAAEALRRAGFRVEPFRPEGLEAMRDIWWQLFGVAGGMLLGPLVRGKEAELSPILREFSGWVDAAPRHSADTLLNAWMQRDLLRIQVFSQMQKFPILLCPVASIPAFKHGERSWMIDEKRVDYLDAWSYCEWFNLLGNPTVVIPAGKSNEGMPIGVQVVGKPWEEELALSVAAKLESEIGTGLRPQRFEFDDKDG